MTVRSQCSCRVLNLYTLGVSPSGEGTLTRPRRLCKNFFQESSRACKSAQEADLDGFSLKHCIIMSLNMRRSSSVVTF